MPKPTLGEVADALAGALTKDPGTTSDVAIAVLDAIATAVAGYDDPKTELFQMATAMRQGGRKLAEAHPEVVTTEVFDRTASLLDAIAQAV